MISTTGAGFVSFSAFIPLILRNHINFFWRWGTFPPLFLLRVSFAFLPVNMKDSLAAEVGCAGGCIGRARETHIERFQEGERKTETGDRDGLISTSSSYSSKPASRLQRLGRTQHVPSRSELPVCRQDFPRGPGTVRRHQENNYADRGERCARSQSHSCSNTQSKKESATGKLLKIQYGWYDTWKAVKWFTIKDLTTQTHSLLPAFLMKRTLTKIITEHKVSV